MCQHSHTQVVKKAGRLRRVHLGSVLLDGANIADRLVQSVSQFSQSNHSGERMSIIDDALEANRNYAKNYDSKLGKPPAPKIAVVTCMDPRLSDLSAILGLPQADIDVIRTGGPAVTEDVLGELVVSTRVLGSREIMLLNHTGCGFTTFTDDELNTKLAASTGDRTPAPMRFFSYSDPEQNAREQIKMVRSHPWIAKEVPVRGFIFDVQTGLLSEVHAIPQQTAA